MPYVLGIDVAQGRTHAATCRRQGPGWAEPEPLWLGERSPAAASALFVDDEGYLLTGDAAAQAGAQVPSRLLTGFHRRIGDDVPMLVEGEPFPPETLTTVLVEGIAEHAESLFGGPPHHLVLTHPGDWGGYRREVLRRALAEAGFTAVTLVPGSIAALGAHLPVPGPGDQVAGVCEFGNDGVNVTLATASGAGGWQLGQSAEGVAPAAALSTLFALAGAASTSPKGLAGVVFCGDVPPHALPARPPCPMFAGPVPPASAALGAATLATLRADHRGTPQEPPAVETTLLPRVDTLGELGERPPRPPVEITPFELPERTGPLSLFRRRRPLAAAVLVLAAAVSAVVITVTAREATAGPAGGPAPAPAGGSGPAGGSAPAGAPNPVPAGGLGPVPATAGGATPAPAATPAVAPTPTHCASSGEGHC
ncbi:molecular chaperone DnaK [Amycolatopsis sp.]|uniref:molecular chaperone DnaK n=1 Tax=Amycolatopsis sp. TaxID=37632 RepID=UPI002D80FF93|nr:molecular chaperone DnaK [Amycolatopsis sp.]HET6704715.1 molecular chaperone DnaK [Amycolatopsis sp.]